jgi:hypothetical protein
MTHPSFARGVVLAVVLACGCEQEPPSSADLWTRISDPFIKTRWMGYGFTRPQCSAAARRIGAVESAHYPFQQYGEIAEPESALGICVFYTNPEKLERAR